MKQEFNVDKFIIHSRIDENNLSEAMANNAELFGFYAYQEALWKGAVDKLKLQLDTRSSEAELSIKDTSEKITEATAKAKVAIDPEIRNIKAALLKAKEQEMLFSNAVSTLDNRGKMLISLGANKRAEYEQTGMKINQPGSSNRFTEEERLAMRANVASFGS